MIQEVSRLVGALGMRPGGNPVCLRQAGVGRPRRSLSPP